MLTEPQRKLINKNAWHPLAGATLWAKGRTLPLAVFGSEENNLLAVSRNGMLVKVPFREIRLLQHAGRLYKGAAFNRQ